MAGDKINVYHDSGGFTTTEVATVTVQKVGQSTKGVKVTDDLAQALNEAGIKNPQRDDGSWQAGDKIYTTPAGAKQLQKIEQMATIDHTIQPGQPSTLKVKKGPVTLMQEGPIEVK